MATLDSSNDAATARRRRAIQTAIQPSAEPTRQTYNVPGEQAPVPEAPEPTPASPPTGNRYGSYQQDFTRGPNKAIQQAIQGGVSGRGGDMATGAVPADTAPTMAGSNAAPVAPAAPTSIGQYANMLEGFNSDKLNDPNKHDAKYDFARIASNYPPTPDGLKAAFSQIQTAYPNAQLIGDDKVDFGDGYGPVDVIRAAGDGGKAWHFEGQDTGAAIGGVPGSTQGALLSSTGQPMPAIDDVGSPDYMQLLQQLMAQSPAAQAPARPSTNTAIQAALRGGGGSVRV